MVDEQSIYSTNYVEYCAYSNEVYTVKMEANNLSLSPCTVSTV